MDLMLQSRLVLSIYQKTFWTSLTRCKRYWWVGFTLIFYQLLAVFIKTLAYPLGLVGGFIIGFAYDALISSFLVIVESMVRNQRITLQDFKQSFLTYFWDVMSVLFILFILSLVLSPILRNSSPALSYFVYFAIFIVFNPIPELIYNGYNGYATLFGKAYEFVIENWPEWFIPNIALVVVLFYLRKILIIVLPEVLPLNLASLTLTILQAFAFYFFMMFRGLLFEKLHRSSRRQRLFQYQANS